MGASLTDLGKKRFAFAKIEPRVTTFHFRRIRHHIWLTQAQIVTLFSTSKANVSEHIKQIYQSKELEVEAKFGNSEQFKSKEIDISNQLKLDLKQFNAQYPAIGLKTFTKSHDRFLIIDNH